MKPMFRRAASLTALAVFAFGTAAAAGPAPKLIKWQTNFAKASATAKKSKKMMMVDFYTEW